MDGRVLFQKAEVRVLVLLGSVFPFCSLSEEFFSPLLIEGNSGRTAETQLRFSGSDLHYCSPLKNIQIWKKNPLLKVGDEISLED